MAAKIEIPESLKADLPQNKFGKILGATPIIMTVIATMLAGLASSEMTKAQYDRSFAAQLQSKAGDQWSYYQAKKLRSAVAHNSLDMLLAMGDINPFGASALKNADLATVAALTKNKLPETTPAKFDDSVQAALDAMENSKPETEIAAVLATVKPTQLAESLVAAQAAATAFDNATKLINKAVDQLDENLMNGSDKDVARSFAAARLGYTSARYDTEARLNQAIAGIYELQVRQDNYSAEKHQRRSGKFFYGMLAAQLAVIISTFAIAARQRSFLWSIAAAAGMAAIAFAAYVYLYV
jgi:flagellar hook-basal body complex protein FliE